MEFNPFRRKIIIRILILSGIIYGFVVSLYFSDFIMLPLFLGVILSASIVELVRFNERSHKDMLQFLEAIKYQDFTKTYSEKGKHNSGIEGLNQKFNEITSTYRDLKLDGQSFYQYLQTVTNHVNIGILSYSEDGEVSLINDAAKSIMETPYITSIQQIEKVAPDFYSIFTELKPMQRKLLRYERENQIYHYAIVKTSFVLKEIPYHLVSIQNITAEINQTELTSWKNLIRVLTHEIMNSVTPMLSLNRAMKSTLVDQDSSIRDLSELSTQQTDDLLESLLLIEKRGQGLIDFVTSYKKITKVPDPKLSTVNIHTVIDNMLKLESNALKDIPVETQFDRLHKGIRIDESQIEQVVLNLLINAIQALRKTQEPRIKIKTQVGSRLQVSITDNGAGISKENLDQLFIPFFTTKKEGSGIGLSLSQEIMRKHNGFIRVFSDSKSGTTFTLVF